MVNLVSNDARRFDDYSPHIPWLIWAPLELGMVGGCGSRALDAQVVLILWLICFFLLARHGGWTRHQGFACSALTVPG